MPTLPTATRPGRLVPDRRLLAIHRQPRATSDSLHPLRRPIPSRRLLRPNASSQSPESPAAANVTSPIIDVERMKADAVQSELEALRAQVSELKKIVDLQQSSFDRLERELSNSRASTSNGFAPPFPVPAAAAAAAPSASASEGKPFGSALLRGGNVGVNPVPLWRPLDPGAPIADAWPRSNYTRPLDLQAKLAFSDRRLQGQFDARFHSTSPQATPTDFRVLPARIILVRHGESEGNVDNITYASTPDNRVPLTEKGFQQAVDAGRHIRRTLDTYHGAEPYYLYFYISPYTRSLQTYLGIRSAFPDDRTIGVQEEVQLREQDFGNFQDPEGKKREKAERLRFGRFFYRFPNGESGADCYDRITGFQDHLIRDVNAGRFANNTSLVLVTHGLALRIFLMRWFHWTIDQFLTVYNPPNAEPLILERNMVDDASSGGGSAWLHTKALYTLSEDSKKLLRGVTDDMCRNSLLPNGIVLKKADN